MSRVIRGGMGCTLLIPRSLLAKAEKDSCTTGKSTIGDEKTWNVFMRLDTPEAKWVDRVGDAEMMVADFTEKPRARRILSA